MRIKILGPISRVKMSFANVSVISSVRVGLKLGLQKSKSRKEPLEAGNRCCLFHKPWTAEEIGTA
jgi:hypothetical protein